MSTLQENVNIIKAQVARMKTALGVDPTTPLEEVTTTIEQGGGSSAKSNIYRVVTIAERDAITDMVEGDMCVVAEASKAPFIITTEANGIEFIPTVTLDNVVSDSIYSSLESEDRMSRVQIMIEPNGAYFDVMSDMGYNSVYYESSDGLTYTMVDGEAFSSLSSPVKCVYTDEWNDIISSFIMAASNSFDGIFIYKENSWSYAYVGCSAEADKMFTPSTAYTNSGKVTGTLMERDWKRSMMYVQNEEPEYVSRGIWVVPDSTLQDYYINAYILNKGDASNVTTVDIDKRTEVRQVKASTLKFHPLDLVSQDGRLLIGNIYDKYYVNGTEKPNNSTASCGVIDGTKAYVLYMQDQTGLGNNQKRFDCIDLLTESVTSLPVPSVSDKGTSMGGLFGHNKNYFMAMFKVSNSERYFMLYNRNTNTWTSNKVSFTSSYDGGLLTIGETSKCIFVDQIFVDSEYSLRVHIIDFATGTIENTFTYKQSDLDPNRNIPSKIYTLLAYGFSYYIENNIVKDYSGCLEIDLNNLTYEGLKESLSKTGSTSYNGVFCKDFLINSWYNQRFFKVNENSSKNSTAFKLLNSLLGDNKAKHVYCITDTLLYLFSNDGYIFSVDLDQDFILIPQQGKVFQIADDGVRACIEEGTMLDIKNIWLNINNNADQTKNGAAKIYVGIDEKWVLIKDNTVE